jgi:hypothetical protein
MASAFQSSAFQSSAFQTEGAVVETPVTTAGRSFGTQYREKTISRELREKERAERRAQRRAEYAEREAARALPVEITALLEVTPWAAEPAKPIDPEILVTLDAFARVSAAEDEDFLLLANN